MSSANKEIYNYYKSRGYCVACHHEKARPGHIRCEACTKKHADDRKRTYEARKAAGLCVMCGKESRPGVTLCGPCWEKHKERIYRRNRRAADD